MSPNSEPRAVADLFCGAGGLSLGLMRAGFEPTFAFDWDQYACESYRRNIGAHVIQASADEITSELIIEQTGIQRGAWAVVAGGPPCQGFSIQRRGAPEDPRNDLVLRFGELALDLRPAFIFMENVPTLLGVRGASERHAYLHMLEEAGYQHIERVVDAAGFGVPQHRRRAVLLAWDTARVSGFSMPTPTHGQGTFRTVRDAIGDLPEPPEDPRMEPALPNHVRVRISDLNRVRISHVPYGGGRLDLPAELQLPCHLNADGHRHLDVFGRMRWESPSPTITAMFDNFTRGRFAHPVHDRSITSREGARLQTFPDDFAFVGPKKDVARQIGNAVPPLLAWKLGVAIREAIDGRQEGQLALPLELVAV